MRSNSKLSRILRGGLGGALLIAVLPGTAISQFEDCQDTLALVSPERLDIEFVESPTLGNRLTWPALDGEDGSCVSVTIPSAMQDEIQLEVTGNYADLNDRRIRFTVGDGGLIGDTDDATVLLNLESDSPNPAVIPLSATLNLSGAGGIFRTSLASETAEQENFGLPEYLASTDITAFASTEQQNGNTRIYAAVTGVPLVRSDDGGETWIDPLPEGEPRPIASSVTSLAVSPSNPDLVFMGTPRSSGLLRSEDGGATWSRADGDLTSAAPFVSFVTYLEVEVGGELVERLYLSLRGVGFFYSDDDGDTWEAITTLRVPAVLNQIINCGETTTRSPDVTAIAVSPTDPTRIYVGVRTWGVWASTPEHQDWERAFSGLVICQGDGGAGTGGRPASVTELAVHPTPESGEDVLFAATEFRGTFISQDGGQSWSSISETASYPREDPEIPDSFAPVASLVADPTEPLAVLVGFEQAGLYRWSQSLLDFVPYDANGQIFNPAISALLPTDPANGEFLVGTSGGGVYTAGDVIPLTEVLDAVNVPVDLGISLQFDRAGEIFGGDFFEVIGQTFQAFAVWRALRTDPVSGEPEWQMIGLYDLTNPEFCNRNPCDVVAEDNIPECYADKRANCFANPADEPGQTEWSFFDDDVFNGYTYHYAVSTLDYGNTADIGPRVFDGDFVFSPRHPAESNPQATLFLDVEEENWNYRVFQANLEPRVSLKEAYAVPNPLQRRGNWDVGSEESTIRFRNVTPSSKVQIYTLAGDLVRVLENVISDGAERGNIQWDTRNAEGNLVASGVYIYRITDASGGEFVNKLTIIR